MAVTTANDYVKSCVEKRLLKPSRHLKRTKKI